MPKFSNALFRDLKRAYLSGEKLIPMSARTGISPSALSIGLRMVGCKMRSRGRERPGASRLVKRSPNAR